MAGPGTFVLVLLVVFLGAGVWVGVALMSIGIFSLEAFRSMRVDRFLAGDIWGSATAQELVTLPLFILMGEILYHTRLSDDLFRGLSPFTRRLPGRLLHVNVIGCALFAAVSGSSAATTATVGRITLKELLARGYDRRIAMGSLAGAGTLGFLIPPSIPLIVYGVLADVSILDLFLAGVVPGLLLALLYMLYLGVRTSLSPAALPPPEPPVPARDKVAALFALLPVTFLIALVLGSMYLGLASVTEAAAVGVLGALLIAAAQGALTPRTLSRALLGAVRTTSMIGLILIGALFLSKAMARLGVPVEVAGMIEALELSPAALIALFLVFYLLLGMVLDGMSAIVMTLPVTLPLAVAAGFDPVWFGVFLIVTVEMAQITPPVGFNLFVIKSLTDEPIGRIALAAAPFCLIMVAFVALVTVFPGIVLWLPGTLR